MRDTIDAAVRRLVPDRIRGSYALKFGISLLVLGALVGSLGLYATTQVTEAVEGNVLEEHETVAAEESRNFETWHDRNKMVTGILAGTGVVETGNLTRIERYLERQAVRLPEGTHRIDYVDTQTKAVLATTGAVDTLGGSDFPRPDRVDTDLYPTEPLVTEPYLIDNETLAISYVRPVSGASERAIVLTMNLGRYSEEFRTHGEAELTLVVDGQNRIIMSDATSPRYGVTYGSIFERLPDEHGVLERARDVDPGESRAGAVEVTGQPAGKIVDAYGFTPQSYVVGYYYFEEEDWVLLYHQSARKAYGFVATVRRFGHLATFVSVVLIGGIGAILGRNTAVAISGLIDRTERVKAGDLDVDFRTDRIDNIGQLYVAFDEMQSTIRAHLRESALIDNASDVITQVAEDGTITFQSPSVRTQLGYEPGDMEGTALLSYVHPEDRDTVRTAITDPDTDERIEFRLRHADDEWRIFVGACDDLPDNPFVEGVVMTSRDVTERVQQEREIKRQNERLEEFASLISHDLRNPLNVAQGYMSLVEAPDGSHIEKIDTALDRMGEIIDDTLTLARSGQTVGEMERIEVSELVTKCWAVVDTDEATVEVADECTITGDPDRLRHVFENLFRNAIEHGREDATITVGSIGDDGLYVEDDGPGIPEQDRQTVFESGYTTADEGTGFGLAIVEEIGEAHGWQVRITEGTEGGARVEFYGVELFKTGQEMP